MGLKQPAILIVRDGWGVAEPSKANAVSQAKTPRLDEFLKAYPNCLLDASEHYVGLPDGQMGNSEVGHLNIGAGRVVYQDFTRIEKSIKDGDFFDNPALAGAVDKALERNRSLHLVGLLSDGGVHSHQRHLEALLKLCRDKGLERVYVHAILDGRDTSPTDGVNYTEALLETMKRLGVGQLASLCGRFYTMDRDKRWERVKKGYDLMMHGQGQPSKDALAAIRQSYEGEVTDEFLEPVVMVDEQQQPVGSFKRGDQVLFFNFRGDRARQICAALCQEQWPHFDRGAGFPLELTTMCEYQSGQPYAGVAYPPTRVENHIASYVSELGYSLFKCAETEKYAHVTFFFNGGVEAPCKGEERVLIPSPKVRTYDLQPEMSARPVADAVVQRIEQRQDGLIVVNFANTDMLGHTGVYDAVIEAIQVVDECVGRIADAALAKDRAVFVTADHGNAEKMFDSDGEVHTAHTTNPVHGLLISKQHKGRAMRADGALSNIAPTLLEVMGLDKPKEMTKDSLLLS